MYKKIALACLLPLALQGETDNQRRFIFHSPAITPLTTILTASTTIGAGLLSYFILSFLTQSQVELSTTVPITKTFNGRVALPIDLNEQIFVATAAAVGTFAGWLTFNYRPEGLFIAARNNLFDSINNRVMNELLAIEENILQNIDTKYIESVHSRIDAYNDFSSHYIALRKASEWLRSAIASSYDVALIDAAQNYLVIIDDYMARIANYITIIKSDPNWFKQLKCYELTKSREAQEELVAATRMANMESHHVYVHNS